MNDPVFEEASPIAKAPRLVVNRPVFFGSASLILLFAAAGALFPERASVLFDRLQALIVADFGWFYIAAAAGFLLFVLFLTVSEYGDIKLGPDESEPEYSHLSWFAMLFSAGMGIGLVFFGVAEPIQHYANPPVGDGGTVESARQAMVLTFFHWGVHAWAIYAVVGLALAYFSFRRGLPLTIRSSLYPLIGRRIYGPIGHAIDIFAVLGTMFGVATSLGFGVLQANAGLNYLFGVPELPTIQVVLIAGITGLATLSVMLGLDKGVKRLSELNILFAVLLLGFVLVTGSTVFLLQAFVQNTGAYLSAIVGRTFRMYAYEPNDWLANWTLFYWGWWIAWSPFVGMFIARISRGRTIRQFVLGVLVVPVLFTFLWMTVFGNTAIALDMSGVAPIARIVSNNLPTALFATLSELPLASVTSLIATVLIVTFFVTSADSGALVIDMITSGAAENPPVWQRIFWAVCAGLVAAVLLLAGGLEALQTAAIASALPFAVIMLFICYGLLRALRMEKRGDVPEYGHLPDAPIDPDIGWKQRLSTITGSFKREQVYDFLKERARPALDDVAAEMRRRSLAPEVTMEGQDVLLSVPHGDHGTFTYEVRCRGLRAPSFAWAEAHRPGEDEERHFRAMARSSEGGHQLDVTGYSTEQIIHDLLNRYAHFRHTRRLT
ncbi:BCCT family transporter [Erythrobacter sp. LQ02-29]|uniref:BCCT family transporter n=1 Tax=Erythrobacter sp. LQ02-29 TaxID=2920384 RepID=UPI001F4DB159|nr:BCCT family transporter [Erythrobacter sp. LQ02-29]MCP9222227.1 BCCT family transporter [Erythrobacter sp. LQ02-29]